MRSKFFSTAAVLSAGVVVVAGVLLAGGPASAATAAPAASAGTTGQSCWVNVDTRQTGCYPTGENPFQQISQATGTTVIAVPSTTSPQKPLPADTTAAPATSYVLTSVWSGTSQTGDNQVYFTTNASICSGFTYGFPTLGTWNDRIKSFLSFNGCKTTLYADANYQGLSFGPGASSNNLGSFNATASSLVAG
ncbi:hypothetical protein [Subtercola sp. RTI3]|uniref:hypothetical protein n=1 Tax=Subtercola sp. RTI3 TaxID=3048639 RepID=UPI002B2329DA|nr:hypothetical protein [Subtercola sp. RTI3]